jgi:hypothetical protein
MINGDNQRKAVELLSDWSKWLIGINFAAATGCVTILKVGVKKDLLPFLIVAIGAFVLSVFCSTLLVRVLATLVEQLPIQDEAGHKSVSEYNIYRGLNVRTLAFLQLFLFMVGLVFFLIWVFKLRP